MSDQATTSKGKLKIGLTKWLGAAALIVLGGISLRGPINSITRNPVTRVLLGTNTGAVQQVNGMNVNFDDVIPLTMTGGKANYNLAKARLKDYAITGSGITVTAAISWVKAPAGGTSDIAISKCRSDASPNASSGTLLPNGNNLANSTGSGLLGLVGTGAIRVNGDDCIVVKSLTNPTGAGSGYLIIGGREDPSE